MPIYEYACIRCGERHDRLQPTPSASSPCPSCGSPDVRRLVSLIGGLARSSGPAPGGGGCGCGGGCACGAG